MAVQKHYSFTAHRADTVFLFESIGTNGSIIKVVAFTKWRGNRWNIAFGDLTQDNNINDEAVSNNSDMFKVLNTVAQTIHAFSKTHPDKTIYIEPVDRPRKNLYNTIFKRKALEINEFFEVAGRIKRRWWPFDPTKNYDAFELTRKKPILNP